MKPLQANNLPPVLCKLDQLGGLLTAKRRPWLTCLLAFCLPVTLLGLCWALCGVTPFGSRMILAHDQWHQYYPFFLNFRDRLQNGQSLFYSWNTGMGTNYLSLYAYYLSCPLNWLAPLIPDGAVMVYYTTTVLVKIGCAGLFFAIFLRNYYDRSEPAQAIFSTLYAFCAFIMGYYWNAIWLDTVALLPLVVLGTLRLLRDRRFILYVVSLAASVLCSYYIGLFTCIFVLLLFIGYNFVNWDDLSGLRSRLWRIAFFTVLALGITAVLTVPAYLGLQSTSSVENEFPKQFAINIGSEPTFAGVLDALRQIIGNGAALIEPTSMTGLPNIYCGVITLLLAMLYCCCRRVSWRKKLFACLLLLFFAMSFILRSLDYIWHGFHFPNMLPYRFSFLFSFVVLCMGYHSFRELRRFRWYYLLLILPALGVFLFCVVAGNDAVPVLATVGLILLGGAALALYGTRRLTRNLLTLTLCCLLLLEAVGSAIMGVRAVGTTDGTIYPRQDEDVRAVVAQMYEREEDTVDLYHADFTLRQTLNDDAIFSLPGVSVFASTCNSGVADFLRGIGLAASARGNRYNYEQSDPAVNLLLGVKYLIDREGLNADPTHFSVVARSGEVLLLENNDYLPMGWTVDSQALGFDPEAAGTPFARIEDLYGKMLGENLRLYAPLAPSGVRYSGGATGSEQIGTSFTFDSDGDSESRMSIDFTAERAGGLSLFTKGSNTGSLYLYVNDNYLCCYNDKYGQLRYIDGLRAGDVVTLRYRVDSADKSATVTVYGAMFDETAFRGVHDALAQRTFVAEQVSDTELTGTAICQTDSVLFTTIPYDSGWHATVDGESVRVSPLGSAFVALHLHAGTHEIRLYYETPGLAVGSIISLVSVSLFLLCVVLYLAMRLTRRPIATVELHMEGMPESPEDETPAAEAEDPAAPETPPKQMPPLLPTDSQTRFVPSLETVSAPEPPLEEAADAPAEFDGEDFEDGDYETYGEEIPDEPVQAPAEEAAEESPDVPAQPLSPEDAEN